MTSPHAARRLFQTLARARRRLTAGQPATASRLLAIAARSLTPTAASSILEAFESESSMRRGQGRRDSVDRRSLRQAGPSEQMLLAQISRLTRLAHEDPLTGLPNRRAFEACVAAHLDQARAEPNSLTLLMIDVDRFKAINDGFSHLVGDSVLKAIASLLQASVREHDLAARLGGDEFVLVLPDANAELAQCVSERIRESVVSYDWDSIAQGLQVSLSIGVARAGPEDSVDDVLAQGDRLMYADKRQSRAIA